MTISSEHLQQRIADLALRRAEHAIREVCENYPGIKCIEVVDHVHGLTAGAHAQPFIAYSSIPTDKLKATLDSSFQKGWMREQLQLLGDGQDFFLAVASKHPGWMHVSSEKGLDGLLKLALTIESRNSFSLYNPRTGNSVYIEVAEGETLCFRRTLEPLRS